MSTFAIIKNGIVINTAIGDNQELMNYIASSSDPENIAINLEDNPLRVGINWIYLDGVFTPPPLPEEE